MPSTEATDSAPPSMPASVSPSSTGSKKLFQRLSKSSSAKAADTALPKVTAGSSSSLKSGSSILNGFLPADKAVTLRPKSNEKQASVGCTKKNFLASSIARRFSTVTHYSFPSLLIVKKPHGQLIRRRRLSSATPWALDDEQADKTERLAGNGEGDGDGEEKIPVDHLQPDDGPAEAEQLSLNGSVALHGATAPPLTSMSVLDIDSLLARTSLKVGRQDIAEVIAFGGYPLRSSLHNPPFVSVCGHSFLAVDC